MNYEIVTLEEKITAGIAARTSNTSPDMGAVIGGLWNRFFSEGIFASIPGKVNDRTLGIYTDYAGAEKETYTILTACEVSAEPAGDGLTVCRIPAGRYARFAIRGDMHQAVAEAWEEIGRMNLPRAFGCDFEEYKNADMEHAEIDIYIGLQGGAAFPLDK